MFDAIPLLADVTDVVYAVLMLALALSLVRLARGPGLSDRIVALDVISSIAVGMICVTVVSTGEGSLVDAALALAMFSFLGVVAFARYIERRGQDG